MNAFEPSKRFKVAKASRRLRDLDKAVHDGFISVVVRNPAGLTVVTAFDGWTNFKGLSK